MTDKALARQQLIELIQIIDPGDINPEFLHNEIMKAWDLTTERQRTLGRLLGKKPEDFIP